MKSLNFKLLIFFIFVITIKSSQCKTQAGFKALFVKRNVLYTKITNSHLILPIEINKVIDSRIASLDQLQARYDSFFDPNHFQNFSEIDKREARMVYNTLTFDVKVTKERMEDARKQFQVKRHRITRNRLKKQLVAGLVGLAGGLIYSHITQAEAVNVLKEENKVIKATVAENIIKLAQTDRDIKILNKTTNLVNEELKKIFVKSNSNSIKLTLVAVQTLSRHYLNGCEDFLEGLSESLSGRLTNHLIPLIDLKDNLKVLKNKAANEGYKLSITSTLDIPNLPLTSILNETHLNLIVSMPLESPSSEFILYEYIPTPVPFKLNDERHYLVVQPDKRYLAVNPISNSFIELDKSDLADCIKFAQRYHCGALIETNPSANTCLMALYQNDFSEIKDLCPTYLAKHLIYGHKINKKYLLVDTASTTIKTTYNISTIKQQNFNGSMIVDVHPGSSVTTDNLFLAKSPLDHDFGFLDLEVTYPLQDFSTDLLQLDLLTQSEFTLHEEIYAEISSELAKVGSRVPLSSIHRLTTFERKYQEAKLIGFWRTFSTIIGITIIMVLILTFCLFRYFRNANRCCWKTKEPPTEPGVEMSSLPSATPTPLSDRIHDAHFESLWQQFMDRKTQEYITTLPGFPSTSAHGSDKPSKEKKKNKSET